MICESMCEHNDCWLNFAKNFFFNNNQMSFVNDRLLNTKFALKQNFVTIFIFFKWSNLINFSILNDRCRFFEINSKILLNHSIDNNDEWCVQKIVWFRIRQFETNYIENRRKQSIYFRLIFKLHRKRTIANWFRKMKTWRFEKHYWRFSLKIFQKRN